MSHKERQTGRTTKMLKEAIELGRAHPDMVFLVIFETMAETMAWYREINAERIPGVDWRVKAKAQLQFYSVFEIQQQKWRGKTYGGVFIDHHALATSWGKLKDSGFIDHVKRIS